MTSGVTRNLRRHIRPAIAGAIAAILLAGIAVAMIRPGILGEYDYTVSGEPCSPSMDPDHFWHVCCAVAKHLAIGGTSLSVVGAAIGLVGAAHRLAFRATTAGSVVLALLAWTVPLVFSSATEEAADLREQAFGEVWTLAAGLAVFSICSYAGTLAAGKTTDDGRSHTQFSLGGLLFAFVPFAIFMGFLGRFVQQ
jgi:hypothetical protein